MTAFIMILKSMILNLLKLINIKAVVSLQHIKDHDFTSVIGGGEGRVLPYIFASVKGMVFMHLSVG